MNDNVRTLPRPPRKRQDSRETRLNQWFGAVCGFRGLSRLKASEELGFNRFKLGRWLHNSRPIKMQDARRIANWGRNFGSPSAGDILEWAQSNPMTEAQFIQSLRGERIDTGDLVL